DDLAAALDHREPPFDEALWETVATWRDTTHPEAVARAWIAPLFDEIRQPLLDRFSDVARLAIDRHDRGSSLLLVAGVRHQPLVLATVDGEAEVIAVEHAAGAPAGVDVLAE